jgi:phenylalanyl-tRNA synthetase beta chain
MKFTLSWLKDHLDTEADAEEIARRLTALGLEVEGVEDRAKDLAPFTVAYVKDCVRHPNADRLSVCQVDTGRGTVQVVCGAPNARAGMKGVFAPPGSRIPGTGLELKKGVIRGVESNGMLCSAREMGLGEDHDGIIELPEDAVVGQPVAVAMGLDDPVIDIAVTPDRADCLGVRGVARDLAAAGVGRLKPVNFDPVPGRFESPIRWRRDFPEGAGGACPLVVGRYFRNLRNGPSPKWLQDRLTAIGLRPISALVDITNYVTFDLGRPLHVFDAAKLSGDLTMRFARAGEEILALDGKTYRLDPSMVVIADERGVHGIGGVMGGELSGCTPETTEMFLEVALFDPARIAATGRKLGIESDARYRFERGVDPVSALWGAEVATRLVLELCGGEASEVVSAGEMPSWQRRLTLRPERILGLGGLEIETAEAERILRALGFEIASEEGGRLSVAVPSWRGDVEGEADLVEEVCRVVGYDRIPAVPLERTTALPEPALTPAQRRVGLAKRTLAARGLLEAVTYSFMSSDLAELFGGADIRLANPISADLDVMRPSILPNLLTAAVRNATRGFPDLALFEVGPQYADDTPEGQHLAATGIRVGQTGPRHWQAPPRPVDAFDAKADALAILGACGAPVENLQVTTDAPSWYHPGRSGVLRLGPTVLASFGELHPRLLRRLELKGPVVAFEAILDRIPLPRDRGAARPLLRASPFQPVERDFAFVVDESVPADRLVRAAKGADKALIADVGVFDVYSGPAIGANKKSVALSVTLQPMERTLTDAEIEAVGAKIVAAVTKATGGELRG